MLITLNLGSALRHLRNEKRPRSLWIDAICINQKDLEERGSHVSVMAGIYRCAELVLIWLGEQKNHSSEVIQGLHDLCHNLGTHR